MTKLAIIGGSGLHGMGKFLTDREMWFEKNQWGEPSAPIEIGQLGDLEVCFLSRHGTTVRRPPHMINYRANMWALKMLKPDYVVAFCTVGGILEEDVPGTLALPDQILDYTWGRETSYNKGDSTEIVHIDFTNPFDEELRSLLLDGAEALQYPIVDGGVYGCTQGPRLETAAEVDRLERDGVHYIGMTAMPEAALARELDLKYAVMCQIVNYAAGRMDSKNGISQQSMAAVTGEATQKSLDICFKAMELLAEQ